MTSSDPSAPNVSCIDHAAYFKTAQVVLLHQVFDLAGSPDTSIMRIIGGSGWIWNGEGPHHEHHRIRTSPLSFSHQPRSLAGSPTNLQIMLMMLANVAKHSMGAPRFQQQGPAMKRVSEDSSAG